MVQLLACATITTIITSNAILTRVTIIIVLKLLLPLLRS